MKHSPVLRITTACACIACSVSTRNTLPNSLLDRSSVAAAAAAAEWCGVVRHSRTYVCTDARTHTDAQTHVRARTHVRTDGSTEVRTHACQEARPNHWPPTHTARRGVGGGQGYPSVPNNRQHGSQELQDEGDMHRRTFKFKLYAHAITNAHKCGSAQVASSSKRGLVAVPSCRARIHCSSEQSSTHLGVRCQSSSR